MHHLSYSAFPFVRHATAPQPHHLDPPRPRPRPSLSAMTTPTAKRDGRDEEWRGEKRERALTSAGGINEHSSRRARASCTEKLRHSVPAWLLASGFERRVCAPQTTAGEHRLRGTPRHCGAVRPAFQWSPPERREPTRPATGKGFLS